MLKKVFVFYIQIISRKVFLKKYNQDQLSLLPHIYNDLVPKNQPVSIVSAIVYHLNIDNQPKISGQFKTTTATQNFAKIRSVVDTTIKNGMNVLIALIEIAKFEYQFVD